MTRAHKRNLCLRLLALCLMIGALIFIAPEPQSHATATACSNPSDPYADCTCDERFSACYAACSDTNCKSQCQSAYMACRSGDSPGGGGTGEIPPDSACPGCAAHCDMEQLICVYEGIDTPINCARIAQRCKTGCYQGCSQ